MAHSEYLHLFSQPILNSPASSTLGFSIQDLKDLSQLDSIRLTGAHLFAFFPSFSFGFKVKLDFLLLFFSPFLQTIFAFLFLHIHTCTHAFHFSGFLLRSYHFEILESASAAPRVSPKMVIPKAALLSPALLNTGEH